MLNATMKRAILLHKGRLYPTYTLLQCRIKYSSCSCILYGDPQVESKMEVLDARKSIL